MKTLITKTLIGIIVTLIMFGAFSCSQRLAVSDSFTTRSSYSVKDGFSSKINQWELRGGLLLQNGVELKTNGFWILKNKADQKIFHYLVSSGEKETLYEVKIGRETSVSLIKTIQSFKDMKNPVIISHVNSVR